MTRFRVSIGWLMLAVALIGFHLAVISRHSSLFGTRQPGSRPVAWRDCAGSRSLLKGASRGEEPSLPPGFRCVTHLGDRCLSRLLSHDPRSRKAPVVYYINEVEPSLYDADHYVVYRLSLEIQGLILALPQLLFALAGGVAFQSMARTSHRSSAEG